MCLDEQEAKSGCVSFTLSSEVVPDLLPGSIPAPPSSRGRVAPSGLVTAGMQLSEGLTGHVLVVSLPPQLFSFSLPPALPIPHL